MSVHVLAAGAVKGLLAALAPDFGEATGKAMQPLVAGHAALGRCLRRGAAADLVVLPLPMVEALARDGAVDPETIALVGAAALGVAIRVGDPAPDVRDEDALADLFTRADEIHLPDAEEQATGRAVLSMLDALDIGEDVAPALRPASCGTAALEAFAASEADEAVAAAEVPEILATPGVELLHVLPDTLAPGLTYAAAVPVRAVEAEAARALAALLSAPDGAALKARHGLEPRTLN